MRPFLLWLCALVLLVAAVVVAAVHVGTSISAPQLASMSIDGAYLRVSLATTPAEQAQGLGGRPSLPADEGMLFVFPEHGQYEFWMKDMRFPIDIIWMDDTGKVIYIVPALSPDTYPQAFGPAAPSRYVLEVPAGFATAHQVRIGDSATLP